MKTTVKTELSMALLENQMSNSHYLSSTWLAAHFKPSNSQQDAVLARLSQFLKEHDEEVIGSEIVGNIGHVTASAHIENRDATKLLLVFSAKEGRWKRPGAHIETEPRQTAIMEAARALDHQSDVPDEMIFELCQIEIAPYWNTPAHVHFEIVFRFVADEADDLPRGARWFATLEANERIQKSSPQAL